MAEEIRDDLGKILVEKKNGNTYDDRIKNNFKLPGELMVTITLEEYRSLVQRVALHSKEKDEQNKKIWAAEAENKKLQEANENLKAKLIEAIGDGKKEG